MTCRFVLAFMLMLSSGFNMALAQDLSLLPKYGSAQKNEQQRMADENFIASVDEYFQGDRGKAAVELAKRGWQSFRQSKLQEAMRRFNEAWMLDNKSGTALWGMAAIESNKPGSPGVLRLFAEAEPLMGNNLDFAVDYAKAIGIAGAEAQDNKLLQDAFRRFQLLFDRAPQHTMNLQNWAITLFYVANYAQAWEKIKLAQATPRAAELDNDFIAALQGKMPRP